MSFILYINIWNPFQIFYSYLYKVALTLWRKIYGSINSINDILIQTESISRRVIEIHAEYSCLCISMLIKLLDKSQVFGVSFGGECHLCPVQRQLIWTKWVDSFPGCLRPGNTCHPDLNQSDNDVLMNCRYVLWAHLYRLMLNFDFILPVMNEFKCDGGVPQIASWRV